ncbi:MAG TPA: DUF2752 domain-containing protein [Bacteroidales bacterium]|nr:DUF2752 domain-containing protein [Bacteroidales bacterium]
MNIINWLESHTLPCLYQTFFGIECPGCGAQRALIELLKGNLMESLNAWPALIPVLFMLVYLVFFVIFRFKNGLQILKITFVINVSIITINYIYKLTLHLL